MLKKLWHWMTGQQDTATPPENGGYGTLVINTSKFDATPSSGPEAVKSDQNEVAKPKRTYTKKKVDNAEVFVADDVATDLTAKGVDVDKAVSTTLKKTSPKPKKKKTTKIVKK
jgi:hypothetical protein